MASRKMKPRLLLPVLLLMAAACHAPRVEESFRDAAALPPDGWYTFEMTLDDPQGRYDLSFYTDFAVPPAEASFPVVVRLTAPDGAQMEEQVFWDTARRRVLYRRDIVPPQTGVWTVALYLPEIRGMRGVGIIREKKR